MSLCGTDDKQLKIELLSQWKLEAEFRNFTKVQKVNRKKRNEVNLKNVKNFLHSLFMSHSPSFLSKQNNMIYLLLEKGVTKCEKYNLYKESTRNYSTAIIISFKLVICLEIISTNALKAIMCFTFTFTLRIQC